MDEKDREKVRVFIESLGYRDVHVEDRGVMDFGRQSVTLVSVKREA